MQYAYLQDLYLNELQLHSGRTSRKAVNPVSAFFWCSFAVVKAKHDKFVLLHHGNSKKINGFLLLIYQDWLKRACSESVSRGWSSVLSNGVVHDKFVHIDGKKTTHKNRYRSFFSLCIPSSTLQFGRKRNGGWYKLPTTNILKIINDLENPQKCQESVKNLTHTLGWKYSRKLRINHSPPPAPPSHTAHWVGGTVDLLIGRHTRCIGAAPWDTRKLT